MRLVLYFAVLVGTISYSIYGQTPAIGSCPVFPSNNVWNAPISTLPVDANSAAYVASANVTNNKLHPDFGYGTTGGAGIPFDAVLGSQAKASVSFYYGGDAGPYPIPSNVDIEAGSDRHAILVDTTNCVLYEIFNLSQTGNASWQAGSGAIWSLNSNALRTSGLTSADAAGLPILPGLIRYDEVASGHINHALRFTVDHTRNTFIWPARHAASSLTGTQYAPLGQRFRLKAGYNISGYPVHVQTILQALKTYGMILADNGTSWHLQGVGDMRWNDDEMHTLTQVTGDNFEAVNESSLMSDPNSGAVSGTSAPSTIPTGWIQMISKNSGKCLDMKGGPTATQPTVTAEQWTCIGNQQTNQIFQLSKQNGTLTLPGYQIAVKNSGLALQPTVVGAIDGTVIEDWQSTNKLYQTWQITPVASAAGYFTAKLYGTNSCLDVRGDSKTDGAVVELWTCNGGDNQKWKFVAVQ